MLGRYILISLGFIAVLWTAYVSIDLIDKKDELSPRQLFGLEDTELLVIHRADEFDWNAVPFKTTITNKSFIDQLGKIPGNVNSLFISSTRSHLLLESSEFWSRKSVKKFFESCGDVAEFQGVQTFKTKSYSGKIYRNRMYLFSKEFTTTIPTDNWLILDRKASASMIRFQEKGFELTDIYLKEGGRIDYVTKNDTTLKGSQIKDKELFAHVLPIDIENYHFYEREFLASSDATFKKSPMYGWVDKGFVIFTIGGREAIISDFKPSQDPVNSLFDFMKKDPDNQPYGFFQNLELITGFPAQSSKGFYAYDMDDYVVISQDQDLCEQIVANYRLGNTLSKHPDKVNAIFGKLPARVSERYASLETQYTRSIYNGQLFQTIVPTKQNGTTIPSTPTTNETYKTFKLGSEIHDFYVESGAGNFLAITKSGLLRAYQNGLKSWEKKLNGEPIGEIAKVKWKDMPYWLITTKNSVYLFDEQGASPAGFPSVAADKQLVAPAMVYGWKGRYWVLAINSSGDILQLDQAGRRNTVIKTGLSSVSSPVDVWVSQRKIYYGIRNNETFKMIDAESKREYRTFNMPAGSLSFKLNNEVNFYTIDNDQLVRIDQKGNRSNLGGGWKDYQLTQVEESENKVWLILFDQKGVKLVDNNGKTWHSIQSKSQNIESVSVEFRIGGKTNITIADGLENDVYLYDLNGQIVGNGAFEGSLKAVSKTQAAGSKLLTTVVDDFIVQHTIK